MRGADGPIDHIVHVRVGERGSGIGFVAEPQHMVGDGVRAYGDVPVAGLVSQIDDFLRAFHLRGHDVFRAIRHQCRNGIRFRRQRVDVEVGESEQGRVDIEYAADDRLVAVMRADEREVLCGEEAQRIPRLVDHRTEQHLKSDVRIALQQIR